jgi:DNA-binding Lrp family transcriptional regulator
MQSLYLFIKHIIICSHIKADIKAVKEEGSMVTVSEAAVELGVSRDQVHYLIKKLREEGTLKPHKEGNRFMLSDEDMAILRAQLREKIKLIGALILAQIRGTRTKEAVEQIYKSCRQVVWCAGAWGEASLIAFLEVAKFEDMGPILFAIQALGYVTYTRTYLILPEHYHVKQTPGDCHRLAFVLLNVENASLIHYVLDKLGEIPQVKRYGAILGQWDVFAEVRFQNADDLYTIVMEEIHQITGVLNTTSIIAISDLTQERRE